MALVLLAIVGAGALGFALGDVDSVTTSITSVAAGMVESVTTIVDEVVDDLFHHANPHDVVARRFLGG